MTIPKISIITPSFNQDKFIEQTILSVIGQKYPNLEYIIIDGGSTENSVEIIKKYEKDITYWNSEPDNGQVEAINKGFSLATGDIFAWINSDDYYLPNIFELIASQIDVNKAEILFGKCIRVHLVHGAVTNTDPVISHNNQDLKIIDYIEQPSTFFSRKAIEVTGLLDSDLNFAFDWEWFIRMQESGVNFKTINKFLSVYQFHDSNKSSNISTDRNDEIALIYEKYLGKQARDFFQQVCLNHIKYQRYNKKLSKVPSKYIRNLILENMFPHIFKSEYFKYYESFKNMAML